MSDFIFKIQSVRKSYMDRTKTQSILFESFSLERAKISVLKGETGIGKTTLLNMLGLMDDIAFQDEENIIFFPISDKPFHYRDIFCTSFLNKEKALETIRKNYFGFMFQHDHLIDGWTGWENIILPYLIRFPKMPPSKAIKEAQNLIESCQFNDMLHIMNRSPATYSGGQRQRTALIRAIIHKPKVIFADEPFASVPKRRAKRIIDVLKEQARKNGVTTIMVAHDTHDEILNHSDISIHSLSEYQNSNHIKIVSVKKGK
ncbi:phosphonate ABC transporter ATP-binding protein [Candidatus Magnetomorum sp. HK-1]|nr:phosphonate ABC transporter ATP-binding protein [Candidatus Magnetomorum sp. HK-1]